MICKCTTATCFFIICRTWFWTKCRSKNTGLRYELVFSVNITEESTSLLTKIISPLRAIVIFPSNLRFLNWSLLFPELITILSRTESFVNNSHICKMAILQTDIQYSMKRVDLHLFFFWKGLSWYICTIYCLSINEQ